MKADARRAERERLAVANRLDDGVTAEPAPQQRRRPIGAQVRGAAEPRVIAVRVGDQRARNRAPGINVKVAVRTVQALRRFDEHERCRSFYFCAWKGISISSGSPRATN